ncbi:tRNA uridine-5-carboxymethylaminomethyl(34) synthesis enzyme MnmG [Tunicatimonas pelagia]|uniref:tRNA uridine-5-carboxymethylaminomethyl(34) synthesis enzyme MnmG n=1 Tax=Tunicatimonas pelagia TaxID=931531 RepID=UPI002666282E|nr:tRNA uridine-5-carboxymethylaminomethyl(34) synthesis enzyme MnmG [Tunicatimonas pelagia]WKN46098.1 tRNA uridine-5-carboxymethylaminomethyl(34) synthesis enzyme MnmG [Tunicatimonas pelagia]
MLFEKYDVVVVGAGHAGNEAAAAAANLGSKTLLITMDMAKMGQMSCNPAMGGVAKGQIVREIDALGGLSGIVTDVSAIQFRMLNRSKGPAMWSPRTQNDRARFTEAWRMQLEKIPNLDFLQEMVAEILVEGEKVVGVKTSIGLEIKSQTVILTNGTFLNGLIHIGDKQMGGGRSGERASKGITEQLISLEFEAGRMKTGTPPRVDGRSLDYSKMEEQPGDENPGKFSFTDTQPLTHQRSCHITYTNPTVHEVLESGFDRSPMFNGRIQAQGPRYCPSIEDKINRFAERERHQIFVEPEGWDTVEVYVNGFSTSLPEEVQHQAIRHIPGFENAKLFRPGYAIEYDYFPPTQLSLSLETKVIENLFFAGQINGTTGYEEAACQGLMAGINAHLKVQEQEPLILRRSEAYIGVLIDDLINKGTEEPYRMFTSRAEFRLLLRQDNADLRLTEKGHQLGLIDNSRLEKVFDKRNAIKEVMTEIKQRKAAPQEINEGLDEISTATIKEKVSIHQLLKRPEITVKTLVKLDSTLQKYFQPIDEEVKEQVEILTKYESYLEKERQHAERVESLEDYRIPGDFDYNTVKALSTEAREKLGKIRPQTIGQASRISGVSPADVSVIMIYLGK